MGIIELAEGPAGSCLGRPSSSKWHPVARPSIRDYKLCMNVAANMRVRADNYEHKNLYDYTYKA